MKKLEDMNSTLVLKKFEYNLMTEDLRKKAEVELHEREDEIQKSLDTLRQLLKRENDLTPCLDDKFLVMFLRARKYNIQAACNLIKNHYTIQVKYPKMYRDFHPKSSMNVLRENLFYFLPYRSPDGCAVLHLRFGKWDIDKLSWEELLKFTLMCVEMALQNPVTQICGAINIIDLQGITWSHLWHCGNLSALRCFVSTLEECTPMRKKASHIINASRIFTTLYSLVRPLITEKMRNRIFFHGTDLSSLHKHLPPEILPAELGGKLSNKPNLDFYDSLLKCDEDFKIRHRFGYLNKKH